MSVGEEDDDRVELLVTEVADLSLRIARLEQARNGAAARAATQPAGAAAPSRDEDAPPPAPPRNAPPPPRPASDPAPEPASTPGLLPLARFAQRPAFNPEDLLGARMLAIAGGITVLLGVVFLLAIAIDRGWLGELERTVLALLGSLVLAGFGTWLQEHGRQTQAARAAVGTGVCGLYLTLVAATHLYALIPAVPALLGALAVGAAAASSASTSNRSLSSSG